MEINKRVIFLALVSQKSSAAGSKSGIHTQVFGEGALEAREEEEEEEDEEEKEEEESSLTSTSEVRKKKLMLPYPPGRDRDALRDLLDCRMICGNVFGCSKLVSDLLRVLRYKLRLCSPVWVVQVLLQSFDLRSLLFDTIFDINIDPTN
ncbi:hypothetical protein M0804_002279 [Polistes exclamans]|nr:hypothetical protein M0804_002279 [Polistes exclamans]